MEVDNIVASEKTHPKSHSEIVVRSDVFPKAAKSTPKATPKWTLKSIKNHEKSGFGLRGSPEAPQDHPRTPKVCKKLPNVTPDGTQNNEKLVPWVAIVHVV